MIRLATAVVVRGGRLLMVASRYANHPQPLWNLPGGRQQSGELLPETAVREVFEETRLHVTIRDVAYISESYDCDEHFLNVTFTADLVGAGSSLPLANHRDTGANHVTEVAWVPVSQVPERIIVGVVREPLVAFLSGSLSQRYAGFHDAGITIVWPQDSR